MSNIDEVIALIRKAPSPQDARKQLMERNWPATDVAELVALIDDPLHRVADDGTYRLSEAQARAILELRLQRLTAMGRDEIGDELKELGQQIGDLLDILRSRARVMAIIQEELAAVREEFATPRRSEFVEDDGEVDDESLIPQEDMVVTVSHAAYIKRVPLSPIARNDAAAKAAPVWRPKTKISSAVFLSPIRTSRCCFSQPPALFIK